MIILNSNELERELGINEGGDVHSYFTSTCFKYMAEFTPGGTSSHLNREVQLLPTEIDYNSPDAHYLYTGLVMVDPETGSPWAKKGATKVYTDRAIEYHTPNTGAYWDQKMWNARKDEVIQEVQRYIDTH